MPKSKHRRNGKTRKRGSVKPQIVSLTTGRPILGRLHNWGEALTTGQEGKDAERTQGLL